MPSPSDHLAYIASHIGDIGSLAQFASRMGVMQNGNDLVLDLGGRQLRIRASGQGLVLGSDEIAYGADPAETLERLAPLLTMRLSQMDDSAA